MLLQLKYGVSFPKLNFESSLGSGTQFHARVIYGSCHTVPTEAYIEGIVIRGVMQPTVHDLNLTFFTPSVYNRVIKDSPDLCMMTWHTAAPPTPVCPHTSPKAQTPLLDGLVF